MRKILPHFAAASVLLFCTAACQTTTALGRPSSSTTQIETIASYPNGTFLENLSVGPTGELMFTSYIDKSLYRWNNTGAPIIFKQLNAHPVGILARANDVIVSAHGQSFTDGPAFTKTNQLIVLDLNGKILRQTAAQDALFLNGLVALSTSTILAADSLGGRIWKYNPATGDLDTWLSDPLFTTDPSQTVQRPGANGLKVHNGWLYISNSSRGALYRVKLDGDRPTGTLETVATSGPIDDFDFLADGSVVAATHGSKLVRIASDGAVTDIMSDGCDSCTSVTAFGANKALIVLTTGNLLEGGKEQARVLRIASPVKR